MPNGEALNEQLEFEERIKDMSLDDRTIFIAKQTYALTNKFDDIDRKIADLDTKFDSFTIEGGSSKRVSAATGGITAAIIVGIVEGLKSIFIVKG